MIDLATDYLDIDSLLSQQELDLRSQVRQFVDDRIRPNINAWYEDAVFPRTLSKRWEVWAYWVCT